MLLCPLPGVLNKDFKKTQGFGERPSYYSKYGLAGHPGEDLAPIKIGERGHMLYAPLDGFVTVKNFGKKGYGLHTVITSLLYPNGKKIEVTLGHMENVFPELNGTFIKMNDPVGMMGSTGDSTNVHVHITIKYLDQNNQAIDASNGFGGAQRLGQYIRLWTPQTLY